MTKEHDDDQQCKLPPKVELMIKEPKACAERRDECDGDGKSNEQHHSRLAGSDFRDCSHQEGPTTPEIHGRTEQRRNPGHPRPVRKFVAKKHGEHAREPNHWHCQHQHDPEETSELTHVITVTSVASVRTVLHRGLVRRLMSTMLMVGGGIVGVLIFGPRSSPDHFVGRREGFSGSRELLRIRVKPEDASFAAQPVPLPLEISVETCFLRVALHDRVVGHHRTHRKLRLRCARRCQRGVDMVIVVLHSFSLPARASSPSIPQGGIRVKACKQALSNT